MLKCHKKLHEYEGTLQFIDSYCEVNGLTIETSHLHTKIASLKLQSMLHCYQVGINQGQLNF